MTDSAVITFIVMVSMAIALTYLGKGANVTPVKGDEGYFELKMNKFYKVLGIVAIVCVVTFIVGSVAYNELDSELLLGIIIMTIILGVPGLICLLYVTKYRVAFNNEQIEVRNIYGKVVTVRWAEIVEAKYNHFSYFLHLKVSDGRKIKIHQHLIGINTFLDLLEKKRGLTRSEIGLR